VLTVIVYGEPVIVFDVSIIVTSHPLPIVVALSGDIEGSVNVTSPPIDEKSIFNISSYCVIVLLLPLFIVTLFL